MLRVKVLHNWSDKSFYALLGFKVTSSNIIKRFQAPLIYEEKKFLRDLSFGYVHIHACMKVYMIVQLQQKWFTVIRDKICISTPNDTFWQRR